MSERKDQWIEGKIRLGRICLAVGLILAAAGIVMQGAKVDLPFDARIITASGILLIGIAFGNWVRFGALRRDPQAAQRAAAEDHDERARLIRAQAGNRAFWVSLALVYAGLMWVSFAANGQLPALSPDALWYFLAGCVVVPLGVYIVSVLIGEKNG